MAIAAMLGEGKVPGELCPGPQCLENPIYAIHTSQTNWIANRPYTCCCNLVSVNISKDKLPYNYNHVINRIH